MKRELKPFVVEVKRGKRRQSFLGQFEDQTMTMNDATRRAEMALFSGPTSEKVATRRRGAEPAGRILPSLIEPPPPEIVVEDEDVAPRRRGRKPGSKNKPKPPVLASAPALADASAPRRPAEPATSILSGTSDERQSFEPAAPPQRAAVEHATQTPVAAVPDTAVTQPRPFKRLRDRSVILARYVHGTAPAPGEGWSRRRLRSGSRTQAFD